VIELLYGRIPNSDAEWRELLALADRTLCTPLLRSTPGLPAWFMDEIEARIARNRLRRAALLETYASAARALEEAHIDFVLIKGFTHEVDANADPALRTQGDIDLLCSPEDLARAERALQANGFQFHPGSELSDNHVRPLLKPHTWQWHGDYFDPAQPVPVELHHSFWSPRRDRIQTPGVETFWSRRESMPAAGLRVPAFCDVDRLAVAALHLLRHVLRNNARLGHAWELQRILQAKDAAFWDRWRQFHPAPLRSLQVLAFRFVCAWFGGTLHPIPQQDWEAQPTRVKAWFQRFEFAPVENLTRPNKAVLWLHLELLPRFTDRWAVARRRLLPMRLPGTEEALGSYWGHIARRGWYHALALARALGTGDRPSAARSKASHTSD
jgi:hypothetical protein